MMEPLVSIIIPTYNRPEMFAHAFASAVTQTYDNLEIIVSDDSTDNATREMLSSLPKHGREVRYRHNVPALGAAGNFANSVRLASGKYVNLLMDDDILYPAKIERMAALLDADRTIHLVTSCRAKIEDDGVQRNIWPGLEMVCLGDAVLSGTDVGNTCLTRLVNLIGEPTTVLFRASALSEPFGHMDGRLYGCNVDMASWLVLAGSGRVGFIRDVLSATRFHAQQQQHTLLMRLMAAADWVHQVRVARQFGYLQDDAEHALATQVAVAQASGIANGLLTPGVVPTAQTSVVAEHMTMLRHELRALGAMLTPNQGRVSRDLRHSVPESAGAGL
jgi:glycosyltransferase involved in cell wall biosynthesis